MSTKRGRVRNSSGTKLDFKPGPAVSLSAIAIACFAAVAAVIASTHPAGNAAGAAGPRVEAGARTPITEAYRADEPATRAANFTDDSSKIRGKPVCAECGIIESVQRIETPMQFTGWCDAAEIVRTQNSGKAYGGGFRADRESLRE